MTLGFLIVSRRIIGIQARWPAVAGCVWLASIAGVGAQSGSPSIPEETGQPSAQAEANTLPTADADDSKAISTTRAHEVYEQLQSASEKPQEEPASTTAAQRTPDKPLHSNLASGATHIWWTLWTAGVIAGTALIIYLAFLWRSIVKGKKRTPNTVEREPLLVRLQSPASLTTEAEGETSQQKSDPEKETARGKKKRGHKTGRSRSSKTADSGRTQVEFLRKEGPIRPDQGIRPWRGSGPPFPYMPPPGMPPPYAMPPMPGPRPGPPPAPVYYGPFMPMQPPPQVERSAPETDERSTSPEKEN